MIAIPFQHHTRYFLGTPMPYMSGQDQYHQYGTWYGQDPNTAEPARTHRNKLRDVPRHSLDFLDLSASGMASSAPPTSAGPGRDLDPMSAISAPEQPWQSGVQARMDHVPTSMQLRDDSEEGEEDQLSELHQTVSAGGESSMAKRKMKRFRLTHNQTRFLLNEFNKQPHPDAAHREYLSKLIPGLSPRQVQIWFQNRRAKLKRLSTDDRGAHNETNLEDEAASRADIKSRSGLSEQQLPDTGMSNDNAQQLSTSALFGLAHEHRAPIDAEAHPKAGSSGSGQRRKRRVRRESTLVFGWDVSVYVDHSDFDSDEILDDDSHASSDMSEAQERSRTDFETMQFSTQWTQPDTPSLQYMQTPHTANTSNKIYATGPSPRHPGQMTGSQAVPQSYSTVPQRPPYTSANSWSHQSKR